MSTIRDRLYEVSQFYTGGVGGALTKVPLGTSYIAVSKGGNDGTGTNNDLGRPYLTIQAAYNKAKTLAPAGSNRVQVVVYPGTYAENVTFDTDYIDVISGVYEGQIYDGRTAWANVWLQYGSAKRPVWINGDIIISCNYITYAGLNAVGLTVKDLTAVGKNTNTIIVNCVIGSIHTDLTNTSMDAKFIDVHSQAFFQSVNFTLPSASYIQYCTAGDQAFADFPVLSSGMVINDVIMGDLSFAGDFSGKIFNATLGERFAFFGFSGYAQNVTAGINSFAGTLGTIFSGIAIDCVGNDASFGGNDATFSGTAIRCSARAWSFGCAVTGGSGLGVTSTGFLEKCTAENISYGGQVLFAGKSVDCKGTTNCWGYTANFLFTGTAIRCTAGDWSFASGGAFQGIAIDCTAGDISFGNVHGGYCRHCTAGPNSFGSAQVGAPGNLDGILIDCTAGQYSFASGTPSPGDRATLAGTLIRCNVAAAGLGSFGDNGTITGSLFHCDSTEGFGKNASVISATSLFDNCISTDANGFNDNSLIEGMVRFCIASASVAGKHALRLKTGGKALFCKFTATTGDSIYAGAGATCEIVNCYTPQGISTNITNSAAGEGSGYPEYGFLLMVNNATATVIAAANTPVKVAGATTAGSMKNFSMPANNQLKYIGRNAVTVTMHVSICVNDYYPTIRKLTFYLAKNGAVVSSSGQSCGATTGLVASTDDSKNVSLHYISRLLTNDTIEIWVENNTAIQNVTVQDMHVALK